MAEHCRCEKKDERVAEQEHDAEDEEGSNSQKQDFVSNLPEEGSEVMRPERPWPQKTRETAGNRQSENIEGAVSVPRFLATHEPRR